MPYDATHMLEKFVTDVSNLITDDDLAGTLKDALDTAGASLLFVAKEARQLSGPPWRNGHTADFCRAYEELGGPGSDPVISMALQLRRPSLWRDAWSLSTLPPKHRVFEALYHSSGFTVGLAVPIGNPSQGSDVFNIAMADTDIVRPSNVLAVACLCHITWWRYYQARNPEEPVVTNLSPRELEVLKWLKEGKSARDIATITGTSQRAVEFHAGNILSKLDSADKVTAIITAIRRGIIPL